MISLETPQRKWASSRLEGRTSWIFSSCGMCSRLTTGTSGTRLVASRKASPHASCSGASRGPLGFPLRSMLGPKTLCGVSTGTCRFLSSADMDLGVLLEAPRGVSPRLKWGHARALSFRAVAAVSRFHLRGSRDKGLSLEAFPRGFPTRLSHEAFPQGCPTCHRGVSRSSA